MKLYALLCRAVEAKECAMADRKPAEGVETGIKIELVTVEHMHIASMIKQGWDVLAADVDLLDWPIGQIRTSFKFFKKDE